MRRVGSEYFHWICPSCFIIWPTGANKPNGYLLGSYRIATAPEPNSSRLTSLKSIRFDSPANNVAHQHKCQHEAGNSQVSLGIA